MIAAQNRAAIALAYLPYRLASPSGRAPETEGRWGAFLPSPAKNR